MIEGLKPYPKMKDSGVPWLGQMPEHWTLRRMKTVLKERVEKGFPDEALLAATQTKGVVRKEQYENRTVVAMKDLHLLKLVRVGDFVISLRSFQGGIEFARQQGIISPAYTILYPKHASEKGYLAKLFKSAPYIAHLALFVTGIRQGQNIDYEKLARDWIPTPPPTEQDAIARFLASADGRIRYLIRSKQKLISLLEEQKQAIVHRAVTRGLDPNARLKPSEIGWLQSIPNTWDIRRIGQLFAERNATGSPELPILMVTIGRGITTAQDVDEDGRPRRLIIDRSKYKVARTGDIAYNTMRMWQGAVGVSPTDGLVSPAYVVASPRPDVNPAFFTMLFRTAACKSEIASRSRGIVDDRNRLYWDQFKDIAVPVPPVKEQNQIVTLTAERLRGTDLCHRAALESIAALREFRTRLISDVVTGKLDVREAASSLPADDSDDTDRFDDADADLTDGDDSEESLAESGEEDGDGA